MANSKFIQLTKITIALLMVGATQIAMGSFTGSSDENSKNKYSLKNFNKNFYKTASPFSLRSTFQYKGTQILSMQKDDNTTTYQSIMRFEKGNTTYIYPYKHKVSFPRFKAPAPPTIR
ncbi:MAG: hypothetical protein LH478_06215 [Chitinophagaceae bacterium]|nr:hypothetical protein [Chitinophagaceae bacterium]